MQVCKEAEVFSLRLYAGAVEGCTDPAFIDPPYKYIKKYKLLLV